MSTTRTLVLYFTLQACSTNSAPGQLLVPTQPQADAANAMRADAAPESTGRDASAPTLDASGSVPGTDASASSDGDTGAHDAATQNQAADGEVSASPLPKAAEPCSDDLTFVGGTVTPDFGVQPGLDGSKLNLEELGSSAVFEQAVTVPLSAETRSAAGYDIQIDAGQIDGTVYAPSSDQGKTIASGTFPLLVAGPGFGAGYADYADFFRHFASYGMLVLGINTRSNPTVPQHDKEALETSQSISWMIQSSPYADHLDPRKISVSGHSKGGKVAFFAAAIDPRVDIVFGWDPSNAGGPPCNVASALGLECNALPVAPNCLAQKEGDPKAAGILQYSHAESFIFGVPPDPNTNPTPEHNSINFYRGALSPASLVYMNGAHTSWLTGTVGALLGDPNIIRVTKAVQTAKLLQVFWGATGLNRYLPGGAYLKQQGSALIREIDTK